MTPNSSANHPIKSDFLFVGGAAVPDVKNVSNTNDIYYSLFVKEGVGTRKRERERKTKEGIGKVRDRVRGKENEKVRVCRSFFF